MNNTTFNIQVCSRLVEVCILYHIIINIVNLCVCCVCHCVCTYVCMCVHIHVRYESMRVGVYALYVTCYVYVYT